MTRVNKYVSLDNSTVTKVEEYRITMGIDDFSSTIEKLILRGLEK